MLGDIEAAIQAHVGTGGFAVAGWSYGAYLAGGLARRQPERIRGLMMVCAGLKIRPADRDLTGVLDSTPEPGWLADGPAKWHDYLGQAVGHQSADVARRSSPCWQPTGPPMIPIWAPCVPRASPSPTRTPHPL